MAVHAARICHGNVNDHFTKSKLNLLKKYRMGFVGFAGVHISNFVWMWWLGNCCITLSSIHPHVKHIPQHKVLPSFQKNASSVWFIRVPFSLTLFICWLTTWKCTGKWNFLFSIKSRWSKILFQKNQIFTLLERSFYWVSISHSLNIYQRRNWVKHLSTTKKQ